MDGHLLYNPCHLCYTMMYGYVKHRCWFVGTYFVKWIELKLRKDKVWMIDVVVFAKNLTEESKTSENGKYYLL